MKRIVGIIPARMASSRLPGKPLALIAGKPMIEHVYRRVALNRKFAEVCIATCDPEIMTAAEAFGCRAIMTSASHQRGTERVAEAASQIEADIIVNIQGDEPLLQPEIFDGLLAPFGNDPAVRCTNLMNPLSSPQEQDNRNYVKVVVDGRNNALYFSREAIPTRHMGLRPSVVYRQIGIYAFDRSTLDQFRVVPATPLECLESCDMLRLLESGYDIRMVRTDVSLQSVDTPADLAEAERLMASDALFRTYVSSR